MEIDKPANERSRTILFRPKRALTGELSIAVLVECTGRGRPAKAAIEWCGSRGLLIFGETKSYLRRLRLPASLTPGDLYVLKVESEFAIHLSAAVHGTGAEDNDFEIDAVAAESGVQPVCAEPAAAAHSPVAEDILGAGYSKISPARSRVLFEVRTLRPFAEGAVFHLALRRGHAAALEQRLLARVAAGSQRRLVIIPENRVEGVASFRLMPERVGEIWPISVGTEHSLEWAAVVRRGFDPIALPAFTLDEV